MPQLQNPQLAAERSDPLRGIGRSSRRTEPALRAGRADGSLAGAEVLAWPDPARASSAPPIPTGHRIRSLGSSETARATDSPCHRPPCHESSPTSTSASRGADSPRPCDGPTVEQATGAESICTRRRRSPALFGPNSPGVLGICQRTLSVPPAARRRAVGRSDWKSERHRWMPASSVPTAPLRARSRPDTPTQWRPTRRSRRRFTGLPAPRRVINPADAGDRRSPACRRAVRPCCDRRASHSGCRRGCTPGRWHPRCR